jgi:flagellar hook-length control protein FliK
VREPKDAAAAPPIATETTPSPLREAATLSPALPVLRAEPSAEAALRAPIAPADVMEHRASDTPAPSAHPIPAELPAPAAFATATLATPPDAPVPPAEPRAAPVAWPARQVAPFAVSLALGGEDRISLTLDPAELGRVEVEIERRGTDQHISLRAERAETLVLLQRDRAELERALASRGFGGGEEGRAPTLSFSLGGEGGARDPRQRPERGAPRAAMTEPVAAKAAPDLARGLLDLAI